MTKLCDLTPQQRQQVIAILREALRRYAKAQKEATHEAA